ncbi:hypothetical protein SRM_02437 [Salinibacter ruber M8]|uniref:Uncharacterized protein n=1 Tax=Salinibacter ruber (strain M8) TaxID=761659 RepID=D5HBF3_SALRM|nr:hypothetical protein SRM_02437 [Salinibacter ruber M8]
MGVPNNFVTPGRSPSALRDVTPLPHGTEGGETKETPRSVPFLGRRGVWKNQSLIWKDRPSSLRRHAGRPFLPPAGCDDAEKLTLGGDITERRRPRGV